MRDTRIVFLSGRLVNLRPLSKSDVPHLTRWINDPEVRIFVLGHFPMTEMQEEEWVSKLGKDERNIVFLIETKEGVPIGVMGIHEIRWIDRTATTGAMIGEKEYWGKGFGTDAKMTLLKYAFDTLNLHKIRSRVYDFNERSARYSLRCGYKEEGRLKKDVFKLGRYCDLILLAVFRDDWFPIWERYEETGSVK